MNSNLPAMRASASTTDTSSRSAPRSTPSLSPLCVPFYPKGSFESPHQKGDTISEYSKACYAKAPSFYNQQYCADMGSDSAWMLNNENVWGCLGAWQWGDPGYAYAAGEAEIPSFDTSHCLSYYPDSPVQSYSCSLSNVPSEQCANTSPYNCRSDVMPEQDMGSQGEPENASTGSKRNEKFTISQYSPQSLASAGTFSIVKDAELGKKQVTKDHLQGSCASSTHSDKLTKQEDADELKHAMRVPSGHNPREALKMDVTCLPRKLTEGEFGLRSSPSLGMGQVPVKTSPIEQRKYRSSSEDSLLFNGLKSKQYVETSDADAHNHHDEVGFSYGSAAEDSGLVSTGSLWMIQSIHNLCKVLLSIQSGTCSRSLGYNDRIGIEGTISMLSELLLYSCVNELGSSQAQQNLQDMKSANHATGGSGAQGNKDVPLDNNIKTVSAWSASGGEVSEAVKVTKSTGAAADDEEQGSGKSCSTRNMEMQLLGLQDKVMELQEVVAYERSESSITVSTYKQLWSEAQKALEFSRSETMAIRAELTHLKEELRSLKPTECSRLKEGKSDGIKLYHSCSKQENPGHNSRTNKESSSGLRHHTGTNQESSGPRHHTGTNQESSSPRHHSCSNQESSSPRHHFCTNQKSSSSLCRYSSTNQESRLNPGHHSCTIQNSYDETSKSSMPSLPESIDVLQGYFDPGNAFQRSTTCIERRGSSRKDERAASSESHPSALMEADDGPKVSPITGTLENDVARRLSLLLSREEGCNDASDEGSMNILTGAPTNLGTSEAPYGGNEGLLQGLRPDHMLRSSGASPMGANPSFRRIKQDTNYKGDITKNDTSAGGPCQEEDEVEIICLRSVHGGAESSSTLARGELEWEHVTLSGDLR